MDSKHRAKTGRYTSIDEVAAVVHHYQGQYSQLKMQTVLEFKTLFKKEQKDTKQEEEKIATETRERPKLLPEKVMEKTVTITKAVEGCTWQCEYKKHHR